MTKNILTEYKTCDIMIKYITVHVIYLMNVLNKLCLYLWGSEKSELRRRAAGTGLLYVTGIIAFQVGF